MCTETSERFDKLDRKTQTILDALLANIKRPTCSDIEAQDQTKASSLLLSRVEAIPVHQQQLLDEVEQLRNSIEDLKAKLGPSLENVETQGLREKLKLQKESEIDNWMQRLQVKIGLKNHVWDEETIIQEAVENNILESLRFTAIGDRQNAIDEAYEKTFEWIFQENDPRDVRSWSNFTSWLKKGSGIYWINGKAASGKSTLMKFIYSHKRTNRYLARWAKPLPITKGIFYFWNSGTPEQRSQSGLLRGILFEVLRQHRDLLPALFPKQWASSYTIASERFADHRLLPIDWKLSELKGAFRLLPSKRTAQMKFCFFIDGLDEFDGDYEEMAHLLNSVTTPELKFCISSRPLLVLEDLFRDFPGLRLQDLTFEDITVFVQDKLNSTARFRSIAYDDPEAAKNLINEVVTKASGVFLWVKFVVKSLLQGIGSHDTISDLQKRLPLLPGDLEALYNHMLTNIDPFYKQESSELFQLLQVAQELADDLKSSKVSTLSSFQPFSLLWLSAWRSCRKSSPGGSEEVFDAKALTVEVNSMRTNGDITPYLKSRCVGLLECDEKPQLWSYHGDGSSVIRYLHRTVRDYLAKKEARELLLLSTANTGFNPFTAYLRTCVLLVTEFIDDTGKTCLIAELALMCASHLDATPPHDYYTLLDLLGNRLERSNRAWEFVKDHWSRDSGMTHSYYDNSLDFLTIAVQYGLVTYVSYKLSQTDRHLVKQKKGRPYLYFAVSPTGNGSDTGRYVQLDMVRLLLQHGADPNALFEGYTPWQKMLAWMSNTRGKLSQERSLEVVRICYKMLDAGADPNASCILDMSQVQVPARSILGFTITDTLSIEKSELLLRMQRLEEDRSLHIYSLFTTFYVLLVKLLRFLGIVKQFLLS